jgi:hypothetical protein
MEIVPIDLPRPRALHLKREPSFLEYEDHIWNSIEREVRLATEQEMGARA